MKKFNGFSFTTFLLCFLMLQACIPMRKVVYMKNNPIIEKEITTIPPVHHLEIGDVLFVRVLSSNDKSYEFFNVETNTNSSINNTSMASLYLNGSIECWLEELLVETQLGLFGQASNLPMFAGFQSFTISLA